MLPAHSPSDSRPTTAFLPARARGLTAATLGEAADSVEERHPLLISAARLAMEPVLGLPVIRRRIREARDSFRASASLLYLEGTQQIMHGAGVECLGRGGTCPATSLPVLLCRRTNPS